MESIYNILLYLFSFFASVTGLLLGVTFTKGQRNKYPILRRLDGHQLVLALASIIAFGFSQASGYLRDQASIDAGAQTLRDLGAYEYAVNDLLDSLGKDSASPKDVKIALGEIIGDYRSIKQELDGYKVLDNVELKKARNALSSLNLGNAESFIVASTFSQAKKYLDKIVFKDEKNRRTFYCDCSFTKDRKIVAGSCDIETVLAHNSRIHWDHIVPISWIGVSRECYSSKPCKTASGESFGGRSCCSKIDPYFNQAQNDLHNIWPVVGGIDLKKSDFEVNYVGSSGTRLGCGLLFEEAARRFQPPITVKGDVARVVLYMADTYNVPLSFHQKKLLRQWAEEDPVNEREIERNQAIYKLQGNSNSYIEKLPNKKIHPTSFKIKGDGGIN